MNGILFLNEMIISILNIFSVVLHSDRAIYTMTKMPVTFFEKLMTFIIRSCLNLLYAQVLKAMVGTNYYFTYLNRVKSLTNAKITYFIIKHYKINQNTLEEIHNL